MVKIAIVQITPKHTEILGTFMELLKNFELTFYYDMEKDHYTFLKYYQKLFNKKLDILPSDRLVADRYLYNFFIIVSSADDTRLDYQFRTDDILDKCIFIQHQAAHWQNHMKWNLVVSPVIKIDGYSSLIVPFYKQYQKIHWNQQGNNLAVIGAIRPHESDKDVNLLLDLLDNYRYGDYQIHLYMRRLDWRMICKKYPFLKDHPRIKVLVGLKTNEMVEKLRDVKFILPLSKKSGWFYWQRLTGSIPLAINLNIPLIMEKGLSDIYDIGDCSLLYINSIREVMDYAIGLDINGYRELVDQIKVYKNKMFNSNKKNLSQLMHQMVKKIDIKDM